jgi:chorismate synthase
LDGRLAQAVMAIPAIKGVEIGLGFASAKRCGSEVHDPISYSKKDGWTRKTNNAGGLEGGITNGEPIVVRAAMKPISTLLKPLASVDLKTRKASLAHIERSDICAVEAAAGVSLFSL